MAATEERDEGGGPGARDYTLLGLAGLLVITVGLVQENRGWWAAAPLAGGAVVPAARGDAADRGPAAAGRVRGPGDERAGVRAGGVPVVGAGGGGAAAGLPRRAGAPVAGAGGAVGGGRGAGGGVRLRVLP